MLGETVCFTIVGLYTPVLITLFKISLLLVAITNLLTDQWIGDFEQKLYDYFDANHIDILDKLQSEFSDELVASLKTSLEKFKGTYSS